MNETPTILIIDDDESILIALEEVCQYQKWQTALARDMAAAMEIFHAEKIDLVLIDYHLLQINGVKGVRMIRQIDSDVPIIVFTIEESQQVADEFLEAGANDFAIKPIKVPDIISRIRLHLSIIENRRQLEEAASYTQSPKGIGKRTLGLIEECMKKTDDFMTVEDIADSTGLARQTVYRYLQFLITDGQVETRQYYRKVGRPKQEYRFIKG